MSRLKGKVALITGGASGIGLATASLFAEEGARVVVADYDAEKGPIAEKRVVEKGGEALFVHGDVSKPAEAQRMVEASVGEFGRLDIVFNNAGVVEVKSITETTEEAWERVLDINLKGVFLVSKYAVPALIRGGGGSIINAGSGLGLYGLPNHVAYCASKGGVISFTKALAMELAPHNIRVNCICPGPVSTPLLRHELAGMAEQEASMAQIVPLGRLGRPEDVAFAALYLASDESRFTTGIVLPVDGGTSAR